MLSQHIVLTQGRSGSNTLIDMLNQNPAILNFGEVLGEWNKIRKLQRRLRAFENDDHAYINFIMNDPRLLRTANLYRNFTKLVKFKSNDIKRFGEIKSFGIKEFSLNFDRFGLSDFFKNSRCKIIVLKRSNLIERVVSAEVMRITGIVSSKGGKFKTKTPQLSISPHVMIKNLEIFEKEALRLDEMAASIGTERLFRLDYDTFYADPNKTGAMIEKIYDFLGSPYSRPEIRMKKLLQRDPLDSLANGEELRSEIAHTRFAKFLQ